MYRKQLALILLKWFQKTEEEVFLPTDSMKPASPWYQNLKTKQNKKKKTNKLQPNIPTERRHKILNKTLANWIEQYMEKLIHHNQVGFIPGMQGWLNIPNQEMWFTT